MDVVTVIGADASYGMALVETKDGGKFWVGIDELVAGNEFDVLFKFVIENGYE